MTNPGKAGSSLERRRDRADVAIVVGALLSILAVMGGAALAAWSLSTDDERYATAVTAQDVPLSY
jgi:hypothetical protein